MSATVRDLINYLSSLDQDAQVAYHSIDENGDFDGTIVLDTCDFTDTVPYDPSTNRVILCPVQ